jgi:hypothetical protein
MTPEEADILQRVKRTKWIRRCVSYMKGRKVGGTEQMQQMIAEVLYTECWEKNPANAVEAEMKQWAKGLRKRR